MDNISDNSIGRDSNKPPGAPNSAGTVGGMRGRAAYTVVLEVLAVLSIVYYAYTEIRIRRLTAQLNASNGQLIERVLTEADRCGSSLDNHGGDSDIESPEPRLIRRHM